MTLYVYKGEWGLPSIDFECIRAMCAIKFTEAPVSINTDGNPFFSGAALLPYVQTGTRKVLGYRKIANYLRDIGYDVNGNLQKEVKPLASGYETLVFNNLHPYFYYVMFGDAANRDVTRSLYAKRMWLPFNFFSPSKYVKDADKIMEVFAGFSVYDKVEEHSTEQIVYNAKRCINLLSSKLGKKKWFFSETPCGLDGLVYAYCSILYYITLPSNPLQAHIRESTNLVKFIERVTRKYFVAEGYTSKAHETISGKNATILTPTEQDFQANKRKTQILAVVGAVAAMSAYAAYTGLLRISFDAQYDDDFGYEEDDEIGPEQ